MHRTQLAVVLALEVTAVIPVGAQERESPLMSLIDRTGRAMVTLFERPVHPVIASLAPGSGIGAGIGYRAPLTSAWRLHASASGTVRSYWSAEVSGGYHGRSVNLVAYAETRDLLSLEYFGPGNDSRLENRSAFRLRDRLLGVRAARRLASWLTLAARVERLWPDVASGKGSDLPNIADRFNDVDVPGLTLQPRFLGYAATLHVDVPASVGQGTNQGGAYRASYAVFDDNELHRYAFPRLDLEGRQRFALFGAHRKLTLHSWYSTTSATAGHDVPFYLQRTLGGNGHFQTLGEPPIGSDGTQGTLRGFANYRFRDRHMLLLQAEYRIPLWGPIDATLFADAGKVATRRQDLDLTHLKRNLGVGLSVMRGPTTAARVDVGFGGGEGTRVYLTVGQVLVP